MSRLTMRSWKWTAPAVALGLLVSVAAVSSARAEEKEKPLHGGRLTEGRRGGNGEERIGRSPASALGAPSGQVVHSSLPGIMGR